MKKIAVNKPVTITAITFNNQKDLKEIPRRMEFEGESYTFLDGLQFLIRQGSQITRMFDMWDGTAQYRLRSDDAATWTLVTITR